MTKEELELFPTSESANRMLSYVTDGFYDRSYVGKWLYQVMGLEYDEAKRYAEELPYQFFPETATWGLKYHEIKWQLPVRENLSYEERRKLIYQKRDYRSPMTPRMMEYYLESVTGFEVHIADVHDAGPYGFVPPHPNVFKAFFVGDGILNTAAAKKRLEQLKQSHTIFTMNYWTAYIFDHSQVEKTQLHNINILMRLPFWRGRFFDGSERFDGSNFMDGIREYDMRVGLIYREGAFETKEAVNNAHLKIASEIRLNEAIAITGQIISYAFYFWKAVFFNGSHLMDGGLKFDEIRQPVKATAEIGVKAESISEEFDNATVTIRKNLAYFDGSLKMDGRRLLNSINRKEAI